MISSRNRVRANLYVGACLHLNLCVHARVCIALGVCVVLFASCVSRQWMSSPLPSMSRWERLTARDAAPRSPPLDSQRNRAQRRRTSRPGVSSFCSWIGVTVAFLSFLPFFSFLVFFRLGGQNRIHSMLETRVGGMSMGSWGFQFRWCRP